jgi:hypothetical protein
MPEINEVPNQLYGHHAFGVPGSLSTPTIAEVHFEPGELSKDEIEHAKAVACVCFVRLIWYVTEMRKSKCSYKEAVKIVTKRSKEN